MPGQLKLPGPSCILRLIQTAANGVQSDFHGPSLSHLFDFNLSDPKMQQCLTRRETLGMMRLNHNVL
jgi:hypothetical protein